MSTKRLSRIEPCTRTSGQSSAPLDCHCQAYRDYLVGRGNAAGYVRHCEAAVVHLSMWMKQANKGLADVGEPLVAEFVHHHLPGCNCETSAKHPTSVRAALGHLLVVLRAAQVIEPEPPDTTPVGQELIRYDQYMEQVRGLASKTRKGMLRIVGALLHKHFGDGDIRFGVITAEHVRRLFADQAKNYKTPSGLGSLVSSLRGYFRWRTTLGDRTHALIGVLAYPANWQQASLPKSLTPEEMTRLLGALGQRGESMRRADAMVHCALDLGLRSSEVAQLSLDDIDWQASTITLRRTKGRREDVMPLPEATGKAIAAYLRDERPKTQHLSPDERQVKRQAHAKPLWESLQAWLQFERARVPEGSATAKAIDYSLKHWTVLTHHLSDGRVPLDNNHLEGQIRPWAMGRRAWLFAGSELAGQRAAIVMSLLQSAKLNGHDPHAYLSDVLERLPSHLNSRLDELLPHRWQMR